MDHDHSGHGGHGGSSDMCSMNMLFTWDSNNLCVVFKWWHVRTTLGLYLTLVSIVLLSAGYEYLRFRMRLIDNQASIANGVSTSGMKVYKALGYAAQVGYSYLLMLMFMTYNGWVMIAVSCGAGLGFYLWGNRSERQLSCH